jgi:hypothetical protein
MVFNATFNTISVISWLSVIWWRKPEYPEKTIDMSQGTDKWQTLSHNVVEYNSSCAGENLIITCTKRYIK